MRPKGTGFRLAIANDEGQGSVLNVSHFMNSRSFQALRGRATGYLNDSAAAQLPKQTRGWQGLKEKGTDPISFMSGPSLSCACTREEKPPIVVFTHQRIMDENLFSLPLAEGARSV